MRSDARSANVPPVAGYAVALIVLAAVAFVPSAHAGPMIQGTLVENNTTYDGPPGRLIIKPSDKEGANGFKINVKIGPYKNKTTGEKLVIGGSRRFSIALYARHISSPGCATYASPLSPADTGTTARLAYVATNFQEPPLPGPVFPEYSAGTPVQICGDGVFGLGFGPYLGIIVGKDAD